MKFKNISNTLLREKIEQDLQKDFDTIIINDFVCKNRNKVFDILYKNIEANDLGASGNGGPLRCVLIKIKTFMGDVVISLYKSTSIPTSGCINCKADFIPIPESINAWKKIDLISYKFIHKQHFKDTYTYLDADVIRNMLKELRPKISKILFDLKGENMSNLLVAQNTVSNALENGLNDSNSLIKAIIVEWLDSQVDVPGRIFEAERDKYTALGKIVDKYVDMLDDKLKFLEDMENELLEVYNKFK